MRASGVKYRFTSVQVNLRRLLSVAFDGESEVIVVKESTIERRLV